MSGESPASILYDGAGNPVGVVLDGAVYRLQTEARVAATVPAADLAVAGAITALNGVVELATHGCGVAGVQVTGTWVGTLAPEATINGSDWFSIIGYSVGIDQAANRSTTQNTQGRLVCAGFAKVRLRATLWTSGSANVAINAAHSDSVVRASVGQVAFESEGNSSAVPLTAGASFTGTAQLIIASAGVQINAKSDRALSIRVQQSGDGVNWDIEDAYTLRPGQGDGRTFQSTSTWARVVVTNTSGVNASYMRLSTVLLPFVETLPRALTRAGNLRTTLVDDEHGKQQQFSAFGIQKTAHESVLGDYRFDAVSVPRDFVVATTGTGGYAIEAGGTGIKMTTGASASSKTTLTSKRVHTYKSGRGQMVKHSVVLGDAGVAGNIREWGLATSANGMFVRMSGTTLSWVIRANGVETVINASDWDIPVTPDQYGHLWYQQMEWLGVGNIYLYYDERIVHTHRFLGTSVDFSLGTPDLPVWLRNENVANTGNVYLKCGCASVVMEGGTIVSGVDAAGAVREVAVDADGSLQVVVSTTPANSRSGVTSAVIALGGSTAGTLQVMRATAYTEPSAAAQRSVKSSSAADAAAGTGARTVEITYYDGTGAGPLTETVTLNGTTAVNTVATDIRFVERLTVTTVGSGGANAGTLSLYSTTGGGGTVVGSVGVGNIVTAVGDNRTFWAHHYVPAAWQAELAVLNCGAQSGGSGTSATFFARVAHPLTANDAESIVGDVVLVQGAFQRSFDFHPVATGFARLTAYAIPAVNNATLSVSFDFNEKLV